MKIAFVYDAVYPWEKGGAQKRVYELARRLAERHDVHLFGMHYWDGPRVMAREGITYHGVCPPFDLYTDGRRSIGQALRFTAALAPALLAESFDVVDCQEFPYFPVFAAKCHELAWDSTLVVTWYETWDDYWLEYLGPLGYAGMAVERLAARLPGTVVPISSHLEGALADIGRVGGTTVVPNGVDTAAIRAIPPSVEDWDLVYVGRLAEHKRVEDLLDAVAIASDELGWPVTAAIVGDGPERERLEAHAADLGVADRVAFKGFVETDAEVIATLATATLFVLPSIREGFPNTILEAGACGVPSVVTNHPENGGRAVVRDGETGFVVEPTPDALAKPVIKTLADPDLHARLSAGARTFANEHDWARVTDRLEDAYLSAITR